MQRWILLFLPFSLLGCGQALLGTEYNGEPLFTLSGEVTIRDDVSQGFDLEDEVVRMSLLWAQGGPGGLDNQQQLFIETGFPARYEMVMYHPPPDAVFVDLEEATGTPSALAYSIPVAYIDVDEDGFLGTEDEILGRTARAMILYLPPGFESIKTAEDGQRLEDVFDEGYSSVVFQQSGASCNGRSPVPPQEIDSTDVDVIIGESLGEVLPDINCDGSLSEWSVLCGGDCTP
jgi:hypothetical protein